MNPRWMLIMTAMVGAAGILIGAFGAHALPNVLADLPLSDLRERLDWLETGSRYHMYHASALLAVGIAAQHRPGSFKVTSLAWLLGILLFSGSLYAMSLTGIRPLGAIVPLGGVAFVVGWVAVAFGLRVPQGV